MKKLLLSVLFCASLIGCKNNETEKDDKPITTAPTQDLTQAEKIANANGYDKFQNATEINFTFNVKVNDTLRSERAWKWLPKENKIELTEKGEKFSYIKSDSLDEKASAIDAKFINDSYWLLFPYQLVWSNYEERFEDKALAPISQKEMHKMTVDYSNDGGYTPGDKYHIYYGKDLKIQEWTYESSTGRTLSTTWEDYENFNGLDIAKMHKTEDGTFQLYFTDISVK
jgi:hypothetical protein